MHFCCCFLQLLLSKCQHAVKLRSQERQSQLRELVQAVTDFKVRNKITHVIFQITLISSKTMTEELVSMFFSPRVLN